MDVERHAGLKTAAGYTVAGRQADLFLTHPQGDGSRQFIRYLVVHEQAETLRVHHLDSLLGDPYEHLVDIKIQTDDLAEFEQGMEFAVALA